MAQSFAMSTKTVTIPLMEQIQLTPESRVDRANWCVHAARLLGKVSKNNRRYEDMAVQESLSLYHRAALMTDHPVNESEAKKQRSVTSQFGFIDTPYVDDGGSRGKLQLYPNHSYSALFLDKAEMNPGAVCLSHNADAKGHYDNNGTFVIEAITAVRSVDVVHRGGTTTSIFESEKPMKTLRDVLAKSMIRKNPFIIALLEDGTNPMMNTPIAGPGDGAGQPDADPNAEPEDAESWEASMSKVLALMTQSDDPDVHEKAKKVLAILHPGTAQDTGEIQPGPKEPDEKEVEESVRDLCDLAGVAPSQAVLEGILDMRTPKKRLAFIRNLKAELPGKRKEIPSSNGPAPKSVLEGAGGKNTDKNTIGDKSALRPTEEVITALKGGF